MRSRLPSALQRQRQRQLVSSDKLQLLSASILDPHQALVVISAGAGLARNGAPCRLDALPVASYAFGMAREVSSVGDLRRKSEITDAEIKAATDACMKDEGAPPFVFSSGHWIDVGRAIDMHPQAKKLLSDETTAPGLRRTMVKTAVIMGFPVAG